MDTSQACIEMTDLSCEVRSQEYVYHRTSWGEGQSKTGRLNRNQYWSNDDGNSAYLELLETELVYGIRESYYKKLFLVGKTDRIKSDLMNYKEEEFEIHDMM